MITIKIHDTQWFKKHCRIRAQAAYSSLVPKYAFWKKVLTVSWITGMSTLEGQILEVEADSGFIDGAMHQARFLAGGFWIPNWAIEWVKETA